MISKIITERIVEYDANGNLTREIEKTTEEYSHDYIADRAGLWSTVPPVWWIDGPVCEDDGILIGLPCECEGDCCDCGEDCGW